MTDNIQSVIAPDMTGVHAPPVNLAERKRMLAQLVAEKVAQGYLVEPDGETAAVVATKGRPRWFGLRGRTPGSRQRIAVDELGHVTKRKC